MAENMITKLDTKTNVLTIQADLSKEIGMAKGKPGKPGKNMLLASSGGNQNIGGDVCVGLTLYRDPNTKIAFTKTMKSTFNGSGYKGTLLGNVITLEVDITKELRPSASGKNMLIATTSGGISIPGLPSDVKLNVNVYKPL